MPNKEPGLDIQAMPYYIFRNYDYPEHTNEMTQAQREDLLLDTRLALRKILEDSGEGYVYSFWPDVLTLKEIGDPRDIATYFRLWDDNGCLVAKSIVAQCRQNTNYDIVRSARTVRIPSIQRTRSSKNRCIAVISALSPIRRTSFIHCIMYFMSSNGQSIIISM